MPQISINAVGQSGIVKDTSPVLLPAETWSDGRNVRMQDGSVSKITGHTSVFTAAIEPQHITYWSRPVTPYYIYASGTNVQRVDAENNSSSIVADGVSYDSDGIWQSSSFNGGYTTIMNNREDAPQYITYGTSGNANETTLQPLPDWPNSLKAHVIRSHRNALIAGNLTDSSGDTTVFQPGSIRVSSQAAPGAIPSSWTVGASLTTTADEFELSTTQPVLDIVDYRGYAYIFTGNSIHRLQLAQNNTPTTVQNLNEENGVLATNCVAVFESGMFVVDKNDIYVTNGGGDISRVSKGKLKNYFFDNLNDTYYENTFVAHNKNQNEMWICYPTKTSSSGKCNEAIIWNYVEDNWTIRDLPNTRSAATGALSDGTNFLSNIDHLIITGYASAQITEQQSSEASGVKSNDSVDGTPAEFQWLLSGTGNVISSGQQEVRTLTIADNISADTEVAGVAEVQTLTFSGEVGSTPGDSEVVDFTYSGSRSNVITPAQAAMSEIITIAVDTEFDGGEVSTVDSTIDLTASSSYTLSKDQQQMVVDLVPALSTSSFSDWRLNDFQTNVDTVKYITFSLFRNTSDSFTNYPYSSDNAQAILVPANTFSASSTAEDVIDFMDGKMVTLSSGFGFRGTVSFSKINASDLRLIFNAQDSFERLYTSSDLTEGFGSISLSEAANTVGDTANVFGAYGIGGGTNHVVTSRTINSRVSLSFDPDTSSDNGDVSWSITGWSPDTDNADDTEFLRQFANKILDTDTADTFTWDSEFTSVPKANTSGTFTFSSETFDSSTAEFLISFGGTNYPRPLPDFTDNVEDIIDNVVSFAASRPGLTVTKLSSTSMQMTGEANLTSLGIMDSFSQFSGVIRPSTQTTNVFGNLSVSNVTYGTPTLTSITLNSNISADFNQSVTVTANSGENTGILLTSQNGVPGVDSTGMHSTYTVTDYAGMEVTSFTSSVDTETATDSAFVLSSIFNAINSNEETPIDFSADTDVSGRLRLTADTPGPINGSWSISVNNHGQTDGVGNITYTGPTVVTEGSNQVDDTDIITITDPVDSTEYTVKLTGPLTTSEAALAFNEGLSISGWMNSVSGNVVTLARDVVGPVGSLWTYSDNYDGLDATVSETTPGEDPVDTEYPLITLSDGTEELFAVRGDSDATSTASKIASNAVIDGWTISSSGRVVTFTNDSDEEYTDVWTITTQDTGHSENYGPSSFVIVTTTEGRHDILVGSSYEIVNSNNVVVASGTFESNASTDEAGMDIANNTLIGASIEYDTDTNTLTYTNLNDGVDTRPVITFTNDPDNSTPLGVSNVGPNTSGEDEDLTPSVYTITLPSGFSPGNIVVNAVNRTLSQTLSDIRDAINNIEITPVDIQASVSGDTLVLTWEGATTASLFTVSIDNQGGNGNLSFATAVQEEVTPDSVDSSHLHATDMGNTFNGDIYEAYVERQKLFASDPEITKWSGALYPLMSGEGTVKFQVGTTDTSGKEIDFDSNSTFVSTYDMSEDSRVNPRINGRFVNIRISSEDSNTWTLDGYLIEAEGADRR